MGPYTLLGGVLVGAGERHGREVATGTRSCLINNTATANGRGTFIRENKTKGEKKNI